MMAKKKETQQTVKYVFIASPNDLNKERKLFPEILKELNEIKAHAQGVRLEPLGWEDTLPGMGRPQELINKDVKSCDLFVMLLWERWGTPPADDSPYTSGTEEEFELARQLHKEHGKPDIFLYFRDVPEKRMADPGPQLSKVLEFRKKVEKERLALYKRYEDEADWAKMVKKNIAGWLDGVVPKVEEVSGQALEEMEEQLSSMQEKLEKEKMAKSDVESKLQRLAVETAGRALSAAKDGRLTEAEEMFASAMQNYSDSKILNLFGLFLTQVGRHDEALEKFLEGARTGELQGDKGASAIAYGNLGLIYRRWGELEKAEELQRKALKMYEELDKEEGVATAYGNLGVIYQIRGKWEKAEEMQQKALKLNKKMGDKTGIANTYGNLGQIYGSHGELEKAKKMIGESLKLNMELGQKEGLAANYGNLGLVYKEQNDLEKAEAMQQKSLAIEKELGKKEGMAAVYGNLGVIYKMRGELEVAKNMYLKALAIEQELGAKLGQGNAYGNLGRVYEDQNNLGEAEKMTEKAFELFEEIGAMPKVEKARKQLENIIRKKKG